MYDCDSNFRGLWVHMQLFCGTIQSETQKTAVIQLYPIFEARRKSLPF